MDLRPWEALEVAKHKTMFGRACPQFGLHWPEHFDFVDLGPKVVETALRLTDTGRSVRKSFALGNLRTQTNLRAT